jgi:ankyrin repeat protein
MRNLLRAARKGDEEKVASLLDKDPALLETKDENGEWALATAVDYGQLGMVKMLVQRGANVNALGNHGRTALYRAALRGYEDIVAFLLNNGAQAGIRDDEQGMTPLMWGCIANRLGVVKKLLPHSGVDALHATCLLGVAPLQLAAALGHGEMVEFLLSKGARAKTRDELGRTAFLMACKMGHLGVVQILAQHMGWGMLEEKDLEGQTALYHAAVNGHEEVVAFLLSKGAQATTRNNQGDTALLEASMCGHLGVVRVLMHHLDEEGVGQRDVYEWTAAHHAVDHGHEDVLAALLSKGGLAFVADRHGQTPLINACSKNHMGMVQVLVQHMAGQGLEIKDHIGHTALNHAVLHGSEEMVTFLLSKGAQASSRSSGGGTALMDACSRGKLSMVQMLLQHMGGEGLEMADSRGATALHYAARGGHDDVVSFLLSKGAQANKKDDQGKMPFMWACGMGHLGVMYMLLQHTEDEGLQETDARGGTALHSAALRGREEMITFLLSKGLPANSRNDQGETPLMVASSYSPVKAVQLLLQHVGEEGLEEVDARGQTALHHAARHGRDETVAFLLSKGAHASHRDNEGWTALMLATCYGCLKAAELLLEHMGEEALQETNDMGWTLVHHAARGGQETAVAFVLGKGVQGNGRDNQGETPMMLAASWGHLRVVEMLLQHMGGQGLRDTDASGCTALHHAARGGGDAVVDFLLSKVVDFLLSKEVEASPRNVYGMTPLMEACSKSHLTVMQMLVQHTGGEGLEEGNEFGRTALHYAAIEGHEEAVAFLLSKGARADSRDNEGGTALMEASVYGHMGVVRVIVQHTGGRVVDEGNIHGWTALHLAASWGEEEVVRFLLLHGADPTFINNEGRTPRDTALVVEEIPDDEEEEQEQERILREERQERRAKCVALFDVSTTHVLHPQTTA